MEPNEDKDLEKEMLAGLKQQLIEVWNNEEATAVILDKTIPMIYSFSPEANPSFIKLEQEFKQKYNITYSLLSLSPKKQSILQNQWIRFVLEKIFPRPPPPVKQGQPEIKATQYNNNDNIPFTMPRRQQPLTSWPLPDDGPENPLLSTAEVVDTPVALTETKIDNLTSTPPQTNVYQELGQHIFKGCVNTLNALSDKCIKEGTKYIRDFLTPGPSAASSRKVVEEEDEDWETIIQREINNTVVSCRHIEIAQHDLDSHRRLLITTPTPTRNIMSQEMMETISKSKNDLSSFASNDLLNCSASNDAYLSVFKKYFKDVTVVFKKASAKIIYENNDYNEQKPLDILGHVISNDVHCQQYLSTKYKNQIIKVVHHKPDGSALSEILIQALAHSELTKSYEYNANPNAFAKIPQIYDVCFDQDNVYIWMEKVDGPTFEQELTSYFKDRRSTYDDICVEDDCKSRANEKLTFLVTSVLFKLKNTLNILNKINFYHRNVTRNNLVFESSIPSIDSTIFQSPLYLIDFSFSVIQINEIKVGDCQSIFFGQDHIVPNCDILFLVVHLITFIYRNILTYDENNEPKLLKLIDSDLHSKLIEFLNENLPIDGKIRSIKYETIMNNQNAAFYLLLHEEMTQSGVSTNGLNNYIKKIIKNAR